MCGEPGRAQDRVVESHCVATLDWRIRAIRSTQPRLAGSIVPIVSQTRGQDFLRKILNFELSIRPKSYNRPDHAAGPFWLMAYAWQAGYCAAHVFGFLAAESSMNCVICRAVFAAFLGAALFPAPAASQ